MLLLVGLVFLLVRKISKFTIKKNKSLLTFKKPSNWEELGFNDKLIIYGKQLGKEHSEYADKYLLKEKVGKMNIPNLNFPKTLMILDKNEDLNLNKLPPNCVIKTNNGSGDVIVIKDRKIKVMTGRGESYTKKISEYKKWRVKSLIPHVTQTENHYKYIKPVIFVEEYLGDNIKDYKIYVIKGKFAFCQIISERYKSGKTYQNFYDKDFNSLSFTKGKHSNYDNISRPKKYLELISISENIAKNTGFDFIRVDLYYVNEKIYLGELTFVPASGNKKYMIRPEKYDLKIGSLWT
tara:strand:+ start:3390 stop:4268 length:879 start_codon:yes stop_codon:yes gene_type:complete